MSMITNTEPVHGAPDLPGGLGRVGGGEHSGRGRQFHGADQRAEGRGRVFSDLGRLAAARDGVLEHDRVQVPSAKSRYRRPQLYSRAAVSGSSPASMAARSRSKPSWQI